MPSRATIFEERLKRIESGYTTCWTVPGEGLAEIQDERRFLSRSAVRMRAKSTQKRRFSPWFLLALPAGAISVIIGRWLVFAFQGDILRMAAQRGIDLSTAFISLPIALFLSALICMAASFAIGQSRARIMLLLAGFFATLKFEPDLVALAPDIYATFYPSHWVADMAATASLVI